MANALYETTSVKIGAAGYVFTVAASRLVFDGFLSVYTEADEETSGGNIMVKGIETRHKADAEADWIQNSILPSHRLIIQRLLW